MTYNPHYAYDLEDRFTERELEVLMHLCRGESTQEIATALHIAATTVKTHISHLLQKSGHRSRLSLVLWVSKLWASQ